MVSLSQIHDHRFGLKHQEVRMPPGICPQVIQLAAGQQVQHRLALEVVNAGIVGMPFLDPLRHFRNRFVMDILHRTRGCLLDTRTVRCRRTKRVFNRSCTEERAVLLLVPAKS